MTRVSIALLLVVVSPFTAAMDVGVWRDLHVDVDVLPEPILVNGLPLAVVRATGSDVDVLAHRLRERWNAESDAHGIRSESHGAWKILSRVHDAGLEVVQWRGTGTDAELLWSRSDLPARVQVPVRGRLGFPPGCVPGRIVSGRVGARAYSQQAASCKGSLHATLAAVRSNASRKGYEVLSRDGQLLARNSTTEITVFALRPDGASTTGNALLYLQLDLPKAGR
jgi:hypothetical protein